MWINDSEIYRFSFFHFSHAEASGQKFHQFHSLLIFQCYPAFIVQLVAEESLITPQHISFQWNLLIFWQPLKKHEYNSKLILLLLPLLPLLMLLLLCCWRPVSKSMNGFSIGDPWPLHEFQPWMSSLVNIRFIFQYVSVGFISCSVKEWLRTANSP